HRKFEMPDCKHASKSALPRCLPRATDSCTAAKRTVIRSPGRRGRAAPAPRKGRVPLLLDQGPTQLMRLEANMRGMSARCLMRFTVALLVCSVAGLSPGSAECPDNSEALGTSRVLTINRGEFTLLGTIQYKQTLPLKDHEVVLTFDDGPLPPYTDIILDTLATQCVKATYFLVGQMARAYPSVVRRVYNEGHTIGTHSEHHPNFQRLSM